MRRIAYGLLAVTIAPIACTGDGPTRPVTPGLRPSVVAAEQDGCFAVTGTILETGLFPSFAGTINGDLVGTTVTTALGLRITGQVGHQPTERTLVITGGTVPALVGKTLHEIVDAVAVFPADFNRINDKVTIDEGVRVGNLTEAGSVDQSTVPWTVELQYRGVVCP